LKNQLIKSKQQKTTTMRNPFKFISIFALIAVLAACDDDDAPTIINEEELITTVEYRLINSTDITDVVVLRSIDDDGEGPNPPVISSSGSLSANSSYDGTITFTNNTVTPPDNITDEVIAESDEHEVFYTSSQNLVTVAKDDLDANNNPLGVQTTLTTQATGTGNLTITLRHEPNKPNDNTLSGAGGETDVEVTFTIEVQ
jgi:hypothetical protein